jgi:hypothetical protein
MLSKSTVPWPASFYKKKIKRKKISNEENMKGMSDIIKVNHALSRRFAVFFFFLLPGFGPICRHSSSAERQWNAPPGDLVTSWFRV